MFFNMRLNHSTRDTIALNLFLIFMKSKSKTNNIYAKKEIKKDEQNNENFNIALYCNKTQFLIIKLHSIPLHLLYIFRLSLFLILIFFLAFFFPVSNPSCVSIRASLFLIVLNFERKSRLVVLIKF